MHSTKASADALTGKKRFWTVRKIIWLSLLSIAVIVAVVIGAVFAFREHHNGAAPATTTTIAFVRTTSGIAAASALDSPASSSTTALTTSQTTSASSSSPALSTPSSTTSILSSPSTSNSPGRPSSIISQPPSSTTTSVIPTTFITSKKAAAFTGTTSATPTSSMAPLPTLKGAVLRIMALGASITWGTKSTDGNGYRNDLYTSLTNEGAQVTMTGSQASGNMAQSLNEGWPGYTISQVDAKAKASVPKWKPNVVLVNAGTNDCTQNIDIPNAGSRMQGMLEDVWTLSPNSTIVLSSLLVNAAAGTEKNVELVNPQYASLAKQLQAQGRTLVFVDMHASNGPQLSDLVDGTHPNDGGYAKMAAIWLAGLQEASSKGWLAPPT